MTKRTGNNCGRRVVCRLRIEGRNILSDSTESGSWNDIARKRRSAANGCWIAIHRHGHGARGGRIEDLTIQDGSPVAGVDLSNGTVDKLIGKVAAALRDGWNGADGHAACGEPELLPGEEGEGSVFAVVQVRDADRTARHRRMN